MYTTNLVIFGEINFHYYSQDVSWITSSTINICHSKFYNVANLSSWKFLSGRLRRFECLCFKITFQIFPFSIILFLHLTHIDGERTNFATISVDGRSSAHISSWTSTNTGLSISGLSTKSLLVIFGVSTWISTVSSMRSFYSSPYSPETTFSNSSSVNMSSIASSRRFDVFSPTFIGWPNIASYGEHLRSSW